MLSAMMTVTETDQSPSVTKLALFVLWLLLFVFSPAHADRSALDYVMDGDTALRRVQAEVVNVSVVRGHVRRAIASTRSSISPAVLYTCGAARRRPSRRASE